MNKDMLDRRGSLAAGQGELPTGRAGVVRVQRTKDILAGLFAASHLGQLSYSSSTELVCAARDVLSKRLPVSGPTTLGLLLDTAFAALVREHPVEYVLKSCVLERLLFGRHSPATTAFYTEFRIGDARADVLLVNGRPHVYEIKTRYDDFARLSSQMEEYYRAFTHVTVFVDKAHARLVAEHIPAATGISVLSRKYSMRIVRPAVPRMDLLEHAQLFRLLREREYSALLRDHGIDPEEVDPARRYLYCLDAFRKLDLDEVQAHVAVALKRRQATMRLAGIADALPRSLRLAPFAYRLSLSEWRALAAQMSLQT